MYPAVGITAVAAAVLVVSGAAKLVAPAATRRALRSARVPGAPVLAPALGLVEVGLGAATLVVVGPLTAGAVAALYGGFNVFIWRLHATGGAVGCGCFGADNDVTPGAIHVVLNTILGGGALATALVIGGRDEPASLFDIVVERPGAGVVLAGLVALATVLVVLADTKLAELRPWHRGSDPEATPPAVRSFAIGRRPQ